jgi:hypothetical protein
MPGCGWEVRWMHSSHAAVEGLRIPTKSPGYNGIMAPRIPE